MFKVFYTLLKYEYSVVQKMARTLFGIGSLLKSILIHHYQMDPLGSYKQQLMLILWITDQLVIFILKGGHSCWRFLSSIGPGHISKQLRTPQNPPADAPGLVHLAIIKPIRIENMPCMSKRVRGLANGDDSWRDEKHWSYSGVHSTTFVITLLSSPSGTQSANELYTDVHQQALGDKKTQLNVTTWCHI